VRKQVTTSDLLTHFVDGSDVEVRIDFYAKVVEVSAYDEETRRRYILMFADCTSITVTYADEEDPMLNHLTEGIHELQSTTPGLRLFHILFADESMLEIGCKRFTMRPEAKGILG
jgi:hypothetical protein